jgi:tRNA pseudouridine 55 synthase
MNNKAQNPRPPKQNIHGWIILDKPVGMTSTFAVSVVKRAFNAKKAGHAGTLDPLASGLLPIALGEATKTVPFIMDGEKTYRFTIQWGQETDTDDLEGRNVAESDKRPAREEVEALLPEFTGTIEQIPPRYSAVKVQGARAYDLARDGQDVELKSRLVDIHNITLLDHNNEQSVLEVHCGKGTYVRAIARDMGRILKCYGHIAVLRRTHVGPFAEEHGVMPEALEQEPSSFLLSVESALSGLDEIIVASDQKLRLLRGQSVILRGRNAPDSGTVYAMSGGTLIAIGEILNGELHPSRVFNL